MDHDGHMDDLIALIILSQLAGKSLSSVIISQGNSETDIAAKSTATILDYMGKNDVPVGISDKSTRNPFPNAWRALSKDFHEIIKCFLGETKLRTPLLAQDAFQKWTKELQILNRGLIVATGPLTNISNNLSKLPHSLLTRVKLFWMGGALDANGNVTIAGDTQIDSEWNSYADPDAVATLLKMGVDFFIIPLDVTNHFQVNDKMIQQFRSSGTALAKVVCALLEFSASKYDYYLWDPIAAVLAIYPHLAEWNITRLSVEQNGRNEGRLYRNEDGNICHVATHTQQDQIIDVICKCLA